MTDSTHNPRNDYVEEQFQWLLKHAEKDLIIQRRNHNLDKAPPTWDETLDHARWLACLCQAQQECDMNALKDWADQIFCGTSWAITNEDQLRQWIDDTTEKVCHLREIVG